MAGEEPTGRDTSGDDLHIRTFLIADVRGYTLFTQERGDEAAGKLAAKFARIAREGVEGRSGTLLELRGDEALCVFGSPRQAIRAAVELQERFVEETLADPELPLTVGIGLDAGEAVEVEGGYRGGALNLAARLCGQAKAGEVLASREVTHLARRVDGVSYEDRGSVSLKGMDEPVAFVRVVPDGVDPIERLSPFAPARAPEPRPRRRPPWPAVAAASLAVVLIAVGLPLLLSDDGPIDIETNSVARLRAEDGTLELTKTLGERPGASAVGLRSLWVAEPDANLVAQLDLEDGFVIDRIPVGSSPSGVAVGSGSVWVTNAGDGTVSRIPAGSEQATQEFQAGSRPTGIAVGDGALWIADAIGGKLLRVDIASGESQGISLPGQPSGVVFTPEGVWVSVSPAGIARVDPKNLSVTSSPVGNGPTAVLSAFGSIWVANSLDGTVSRLDPSTGQEQTSIPVGRDPNALAAVAGSVWIANEFDGSITEIESAANHVSPAVPVGGSVASLAADGDSLWLSVGSSAAEHRGGTLHISSSTEAPASLDPAVAYDVVNSQILAITNDGLLGYKKVGGLEGAVLVPDLAVALPQVSADGLSYRFIVRKNVFYSTGEPVRPEDFRQGFERSLSLSKPAVAIFRAIVGASACFQKPSECDLGEAVEVGEDSVTIHLARPDPDLPSKLTLPFAFPVPSGIPAVDQGLLHVPATGPYVVAEAGPDGIELERNSAFHEWSGSAQPDGFVDAISWTFNEDDSTAFDRLTVGQVDWITDPQPEDVSSLQIEHPEQIVRTPEATTIFVGFDVTKPPFNDVRVRQAVNYAIDRDRVVELLGDATDYRPTCQILPPNFDGYEPFCPYTMDPGSGEWSAPDMDRARALINDAGADGDEVIVWTVTKDQLLPHPVETMRYVAEVLNDIGLDAQLKIQDPPNYLPIIYASPPSDAPSDPHVYLSAWLADYLRASDFIEQFRCGSSFNAAGLCRERLDARIDAAKQLQEEDPAAANAAWIEIEHQLVSDAVWAPLANPLSGNMFSARTENVQVQSQWGVLLSRLWVQ